MKAIAIATVGAFLVVAALAANQPLDGRTFEVTLTQADGTSAADTLVFAEGTLDSTACHEYGFGPAAYLATLKDGGVISFESTAESKDGGTNHWRGRVDGNGVQGTLEYTDGKGQLTTYRFEGEESDVDD